MVTSYAHKQKEVYGCVFILNCGPIFVQLLPFLAVGCLKRPLSLPTHHPASLLTFPTLACCASSPRVERAISWLAANSTGSAAGVSCRNFARNRNAKINIIHTHTQAHKSRGSNGVCVSHFGAIKKKNEIHLKPVRRFRSLMVRWFFGSSACRFVEVEVVRSFACLFARDAHWSASRVRVCVRYSVCRDLNNYLVKYLLKKIAINKHPHFYFQLKVKINKNKSSHLYYFYECQINM